MEQLRLIRQRLQSMTFLLSIKTIKSDHENLTDNHYLPGAGPLPVEIRFDYLRNLNGSVALHPGSPGSGSPPGSGSSVKESYWTIACYPDQPLVYDDVLLCSDGCRVDEKDESDCGPQYHKLHCNCS